MEDHHTEARKLILKALNKKNIENIENIDRPALSYYDELVALRLTFREIEGYFTTFDETIDTIRLQFRIKNEILPILFYSKQDIFGILFTLYCFCRGLCYIPLTCECDLTLMHQLSSLKLLFSNVLLVCNNEYTNIIDFLQNITFINSEKAVNAEFSVDQIKIDILFKKISFLNENPIIPSFKCPPIMYVSYSSGTTGPPKSVTVPHSCFLPCLHHSIEAFKINKDSKIFLSSPFTFDPSILQLLLAYSSMGELIACSSSIKSRSKKLAAVFVDSHLTHLQCTPSFLYRFGDDLVSDLLRKSDIKHLIIGGEKFPSPDKIKNWLKEIINSDSVRELPRFINLYGTTEVSPWASYFVIDNAYLIEYMNNKVNIPIIGRLFPDTLYRIETLDPGIHILQIGSNKRICFLDNDKPDIFDSSLEPIFRDTGDIVTIEDYSNIYFKGRSNNSIKKYGTVFNLDFISYNVQQELNHIFDSCFFISDNSTHISENLNLIVFCYKLNFQQRTLNNKTVESMVKKVVPKLLNPFITIEFNQLSTNDHGKLDKTKMIEKRRLFCHNNYLSEVHIKYIVAEIWIESLSYSSSSRILESIHEKSNFIDLGGDSLCALYFVNAIYQKLFYQKDNEDMFDFDLLVISVQNSSYEDVIKLITNWVTQLSKNYQETTVPHKDCFQLKPYWSVDTFKCVDASPIFDHEGKKYVYVGSHSGLFFCIDLQSGDVIWKYDAGNRIEATASISSPPDYVLIGAHDCHMHILRKVDGTLHWKCPTDDIIKCTAYSLENYDSLFGCHDGSIYYINISRKEVKWKILIDGSILSSMPTYCKSHQLCYVATLGGTIGCYTILGVLVWKRKISSPIFSALRKCYLGIVVAAVNGLVCLLSKTKGEIIWEFDCNGLVYGKISIVKHKSTDRKILAYITTQDGYIHTLDISSGKIVWSINLSVSLYSGMTIAKISKNKIGIFLISTDGVIYILDSVTRQVICKYVTNAKCFSSILFFNRRIIIGSRNNNVICYKIEKLIKNI